ncbi:MAG: alpha/beta fold hydrolase [Burkholderiales bacterium]|nr:alpha/beta fold hydrolase [Burkholderiales bacterium]
MVERITRILLLVQLNAALGIAFAVYYFTASSIVSSLLLGLGAVVLVRLAINANNFFLAWIYGSETPPEHRLNTWQALKMYREEFVSSMLTSSWHMPFHAFSRRDMALSKALPVLLIHGYGCNSGYWYRLSKRLSSEDIGHRAIDLEPVFGGIDDFVPLIHEAVESYCRETGHEKIIIIAHSMGGLAVRAYLCAHGTTRVAKVITVATPHHGTGLAHFGKGENSRQMHWIGSASKGAPSDWLCRLKAKENSRHSALFTSFYSHQDNIVAPQESCYLPGARNIAMHGIGHVALGMNRQVHDIIVQEIRMLC